MGKCKIAESANCGKNLCCHDCPEKLTGCEFVCEGEKEDCPDYITEEIATFDSSAGDLITKIAGLERMKTEIEAQEKEFRAELLKAMEQYSVKTFDSGNVRFTYVAPTTRSTIDGTRLKKERPEIVAEYTKVSAVAASVRIKVN